jgi:beta-glucosidase
VLGSATVNATADALDEDPVGVGEGLRDRVHTVMYALLQTDLFK